MTSKKKNRDYIPKNFSTSIAMKVSKHLGKIEVGHKCCPALAGLRPRSFPTQTANKKEVSCTTGHYQERCFSDKNDDYAKKNFSLFQCYLSLNNYQVHEWKVC